MKEFILLIAVAVWMAAPAHAQLNIRKASDKPKEEAVLALHWNWLYSQDGAWYITAKTSNQFDDWIWISLGSDGNSAIESVQQLIDLVDTLGDDERVNIDDRYGKIVLLSLYSVAGKRMGFKMAADGKAGISYLTTAALKKAVQHIRGKMSMEQAQRQRNGDIE